MIVVAVVVIIIIIILIIIVVIIILIIIIIIVIIIIIIIVITHESSENYLHFVLTAPAITVIQREWREGEIDVIAAGHCYGVGTVQLAWVSVRV